MPYGNVRARLTPALGALTGTTLAAKGIGKTNRQTVNSGLGGAGAKLKNPKATHPLKLQQQDIAMAQAMGLKGSQGAKPRSSGRQDVAVVKQTKNTKPIPKSKPTPKPALVASAPKGNRRKAG